MSNRLGSERLSVAGRGGSGAVFIVLSWLIATLSPVEAQAPLPADHPLAGLIPAAAAAPAPDWVKPGMRLTFWSQAVTPSLDPNEQGKAGEGFTEVDVLAVSKDTVVLKVRAYSGPTPGNPSKPILVLSLVSPACAGGEAWVHPDLLKRIVDIDRDEVKVIQGPYSVNNQTYQAIRVEIRLGGHTMIYNYDQATGILLRSLSEGPPPRVGLGKSSGLHQFLARRQLNLPWANSAMPAWAKTVKRLDYQGQSAIIVPGSLPMASPCSATLQIKQRGDNWLIYDQTVTTAIPGMPPQTQTLTQASGSAAIGGLWVSPAALAQLRQGQTIDTDPLTQVKLSVSQVGEVVVLTESGGAHQIDYRYDREQGKLVGFRLTTVTDPLTQITTQMEMQLVGEE